MPRRLLVVIALGALVSGAVAGVVLATRESAPAESAGTPATDPGASRLTEPVGRYVALGDSFTAGPLIPYVDASRTSCLRSSANYPAVLGRWLRADTVADVSCSGADTTDVAQQQVRAVTPATDLVTVGMGGNDFGIFGTLVRRCPELTVADPAGAPCRAAFTRPDGSDQMLALAARVEGRLVGALRAVGERAPDAVVAVVGYPRIVPATGSCDALPFAAGDYAWADRVERRLNRSLRLAARRTDALYVDTYGPSGGHDACAAAAWVNGQDTRATRALAYHPYARGMRASAVAVYRTVTGVSPSARMRDRAEQLTARRPPGTLTLRHQRVIAALLGGG